MALSDSLISYWSLEEASGTRNDSHGSNHLTDNNTVTQNTGKVGNAGQFTSANSEYLSIADNASLSTGDIDFTMACWFYIDSHATRCLMAKWDDPSSQQEYFLGTVSNQAIFFVSSNGTASTSLSASTFGALSVGVWYFVVAWHDSVNNQIGISVNDTANTQSYSSGVFDSTTGFKIGANRGTPVNHWNGRIDEAAFWKRVLTSGERTELYNSGSGRDYTYVSAAAGQPAALRQSLFNGQLFGRGIN